VPAALEWSFPQVHDVLASAVPDRDMLVWGSTRRTFAEVTARSRGLGAFLRGRGLGAHRERAGLEQWECGQDRVALLLYNCPEYVEAMLGAFRARAVPCNVNQHYTAAETDSLFGLIRPHAVVYHRALGPRLAEALGDRAAVLIDVDDGSGTAPRPGSTSFEEACATPAAEAALPVASPDDIYLVCTGGTTGRPKGVLWRQGDIFCNAMGGTPTTTAESLTATAQAGGGAWFATPPLMHAAAQWTTFGALHAGTTVVLHDDSKPFDARSILETAARERVTLMTIVGDAYTRPIVDELRRVTYDLSSLRVVGTGGAITSEHCKEALLGLLPDVTIIDGYGASESGTIAAGRWSRDARARTFAPGPGTRVLSEDRSRFLAPGDDEIGWTARGGPVPLGYLDDPDATHATFPVVEGQRVSVPGDRVRLTADGTIEMLGRDSMIVNTGGEKVFVEEVEEALRRHDDIVDAVVVGRPSDRFGQEIVAVVQVRDGAVVHPNELREFVAGSLARFKAPRAVALCERVPRHANGKADYGRAKQLAVAALDATAVGRR
jgi:fatty-acyl-CoA synthase